MVYVAGKRFPLKNAVFQRQIAACGAVFRNGDRAGVQIEVFLAERLPRGYMCMAVQENIAGAERRQVRGVVDVAVRGVDQPVSNREDAVIGQNREGCTDFTGIFGEFTAAQRGDVRIAPYIQRGNCLRFRRAGGGYRVSAGEPYSSQLPTVRGNGSTSRMLEMPVRYMTQRSKPRPKPAWRVEPYLRRSR